MSLKSLKKSHPRGHIAKLIFLASLGLFCVSIFFFPGSDELQSTKATIFSLCYYGYVGGLLLTVVVRSFPVSSSVKVSKLNIEHYKEFAAVHGHDLDRWGLPRELDPETSYNEFKKMAGIANRGVAKKTLTRATGHQSKA